MLVAKSGTSLGSQTSRNERYWTSSGKNCVLSWCAKKPPTTRKSEGAGEDEPAVIRWRRADAIVEAAESRVRRSSGVSSTVFVWAEQVVAEERDEGHRDEARCDERAGHHDRQAVEKFAGGAVEREEREIGDDVGDRREEDGVGEFCWSEPACDDGRMLVGERAFDGVAGDDGIVDEQAERDDQRGDRDLLEVDAEQVGEAEGEGERDGNRDRHQHGGAPFPESDERDDDDERDRFVERVHEEIDVFFDLARLVGGVGDDQVGGEKLARFFQFFFDVLGEFCDLLAHFASARPG